MSLTCISHSRFHPSCRVPSEPAPWPGSGTPRLLICSAPAGREHQPAGSGPGNLKRHRKCFKNQSKDYLKLFKLCEETLRLSKCCQKNQSINKIIDFMSCWTLIKCKILNVKQSMLLTHSQEESQCKSHEFHGWALKENTPIIPSNNFIYKKIIYIEEQHDNIVLNYVYAKISVLLFVYLYSCPMHSELSRSNPPLLLVWALTWVVLVWMFEDRQQRQSSYIGQEQCVWSWNPVLLHIRGSKGRCNKRRL